MKHFSHAVHRSIALAAFLIIAAVPSIAQVSLKLGGGLGVMIPASDFGGSTVDYYTGSRYGLGNGINLDGKAKIGLVGFNITGEIDYASLSNNGNSEAGLGTIDVSQKILSMKVGPEFRLGVPASPITPYLGANIAVNRFSGETTFQGVARIPSGTYSMKDATRLGVGFSAGLEVSISPSTSLDFNLSYNLMNVSGSQWEDVNPDINRRLDSYLALNDAQDPSFSAADTNHFISNDRSIHSLLFTVSVLFGL